jgi:hypothetical protein
MKQKSFNVAYCGIICALSTMVMFAAIIPSMTYIMPAVSGLIIWSVAALIGVRWGFMTYAAAAILSLFLVPEPEAKTLFILLFGHYPVLRGVIHRLRLRLLRFLIKLAVFNTAAVISYQLAVRIFGVADALDGLEWFGEYAVYAFWAMGNFAFFFYDFALRHLTFVFNNWLKPIINKKIR